MKFKKENTQVYYATDEIVKINKKDIEQLKQKMKRDNVARARMCAHKKTNDGVHEMFIILKKENYVRPHRHLNRSESFYLIEGRADIIIFNQDGSISETFKLGESNTGEYIFCRMSPTVYHTVIPDSEYLVLLETTSGPLVKNTTEYAVWSPDEGSEEGSRYITEIKKNMAIRN